jgi:phospholipid/cholesterol/gamma-HCH transport system ATP-binding protein
MFSDMGKTEQTERASFCLRRVNIEPKAFNLYPSEISGGMQKRVAIARAIAMNPLYLFCDEPNSGLDPQTSLIIDQLIHEITEEFQITTVINSHDMNSVMEIGDNIVFIEKGEKSWQGNRTEIFDTGNQALENFVFASDLYKKLKISHSLLAD